MSLTPIVATFSAKSNTNVSVSSYNDGNISFSGFTLTNPLPIVTICRKILALVGAKAKPYPLQVFKGTKLEFTVRSIQWGSLVTADTFIPDYELIDNQILDRTI